MCDNVKRRIHKARVVLLCIAVVHVVIACIIYSLSIHGIGFPVTIQLANLLFYMPAFVVLEDMRLAVRFFETDNLTCKLLSILLILIQTGVNIALICMNWHVLVQWGFMQFLYNMMLSIFKEALNK